MFVASYSLNAQSAWVQPKDNIYVQLSYNSIANYDRIFNGSGDDLYTSREVSDNTAQLYIEYGLTNKLSLIGSVPLKNLSTGDVVSNSSLPLTIAEDDLLSLGNVQVAARLLLSNKKYSISTQLQLDLPTSKYDNNTGLRTGFEAYTFYPSFSIGRGKEGLYFQVTTGLFLRTNQYSNGFKFYLEGGKKFFDQLWIIPFIDINESFRDGNVSVPIRNLETFTALDTSEFGGFGLKVIEEISPKFGITGAVGGAFYANFEAHKASLNFGMYYKFGK